MKIPIGDWSYSVGDVQTHGEKKPLKNFPVTVEYVTNALSIFGPNLARVRGKTVRNKPDWTETEILQIPRGVDFLTTLSRNIILLTAEHIPSRTASQLSNYLNKILKL